MNRLKSQTWRIAMRASKAFVLGAIMGAAAVWLWGRDMKEYEEDKTRGVRMKAAESVRAVEERLGKCWTAVEMPCVGPTSSCRIRRSM